jgi:hypothetical protein
MSREKRRPTALADKNNGEKKSNKQYQFIKEIQNGNQHTLGQLVPVKITNPNES